MYGLFMGHYWAELRFYFWKKRKKKDGRMSNRQKWKGKKTKPNLKAHLLRYVRSDRRRHDRTLHLTLPGYQHTLWKSLRFILISLQSKGDLTFLT